MMTSPLPHVRLFRDPLRQCLPELHPLGTGAPAILDDPGRKVVWTQEFRARSTVQAESKSGEIGG
jgi:hypothetical protein